MTKGNNELYLIISGEAAERIKEGTQTEVYFPIVKRLVNKFISEEGQANYLIHLKRGAALVNAVLAAWDTKYTNKIRSITFRYGTGKCNMMCCKVKSIVIKTGNAEWGAEPGLLCFVVRLGEVYKLVERQ